MYTRISRWGHSLALRLPRAFVREVHLAEGTPVELTIAGGQLVVTPLRREYRLDDLVAAITPDNRHEETNWGSPVGHEVW